MSVDRDQQILKRQRSTAKGVVTRLANQINLAMDNNRHNETVQKLQDHEAAVTKFKEAHAKYHDTLVDEDDIDISESYHTTVLRDAHDLKHVALSWVSEREHQENDDTAAASGEGTTVENRESNQQPVATGPNTTPEFDVKQAQELEERLRRELQLQPTSHQMGRQTTANPLSQLTPSTRNELTLVELLELTQRQHQTHVDSMRLPPADMIKFDGEPLKYWQFMRLFSTTVDKGTIPAEQKLTRLLQYTTGRARDAIEHCLYNPDPSVGYDNAMGILRKRFGNPFSISQAWVSKVLEYKLISNNHQLQGFADTLRSCDDTLKAMGCTSELDSGRTLLQIVEKLPDDLKRRWLNRNYEITESGRLPKFGDVVTLVEVEAAKRADPIFGNLLNRKTPTSSPCSSGRSSSNNNNHYNNNPNKVKNKGAFATEAAAVSRASAPKTKEITFKCPKCNAGHFLNQCSAFRGMTVQERLTMVRQKKLCQNCFMAGHKSEACTRTWVCKVPGCGMKHNSWLHSAIVTTTNNNNNDDNNPTTPATRSESTDNPTTEVQSTATKKGIEQSRNKVALPIIPIVVSDPDGQFSMNVFALLDNGANGSFCSKKLIRALRLETQKRTIKLSTMESRNVNIETVAVDLQVEDARRHDVYLMKGVLSREHLNISLNNLVTVDEVSKWSHLQDIADDICPTDIDLAEEVHLLIGLDQPDILAPREVRRGNPGEPYATLTGLGWTLNGPVADGQPTITVNYAQSEDPLQQAVERFWSIDDVHIHDGHTSMSVTDKRVVKMWEEQGRKVDGHYTLPIPFKEGLPQLPNNYPQAKRRLDLLGRRLTKDPELKRKYMENVNDSLKKGYAEPVTEVEGDDGSVWYLPHHPVLHPHKPEKVRVVFDCSARYQGTSLNDQVHQGPDLTNKLLGVLLRFRQEPIALTADIEGMFCQVKVPPQQRDVLRFLWWEDDDPAKSPKQYRVTNHLFGGVWSPSAANFALRQVAKETEHRFNKLTIETVTENFYVDDCLKSVPDEESAVKLVEELRALLADASFKLTKWLSNSKKVMKGIPKEEWAKSLHSLDLDRDELPHDRTLGVTWDVERDVFTFDVKVQDKPQTKRGMLSMTSSVYDPLGLAGPFILRAKALFQELCRRKVDWDEGLPNDVAEQWQRWLVDLPLLTNLTIPRCLLPSGDPLTVRLHHFSDASELAYGAVSYIQTKDECSLVMSKSRLAPIKPTSIPRLELLGAVLATDLDQYIKTHLQIPITETYFWTDSMIVLQYINNTERRFKTFVANRVAKIRERSDCSQWKYIDTASNPADEVSRGMAASEILSNKRWVSGPAFLQHKTWPAQPELGKLPEDAEIKQTKEIYTTGCVLTDGLESLLLRYSNWHRLKRAAVYILRLKALLRQRDGKRLLKPVTVEELRVAEEIILQHVQSSCLGPSKSMTNLKPFEKDETKLLRVGGRLINAPIPYDAKHPILLPSDHHVTRLIINHYHLRLGHSGPERVLSEIRQRFWILKGRRTVNVVLKACMVCRKQRATPQHQQMANLPDSRVTPNRPPFSYVGVDYFGPFTIKRGRSEVKRYGCLFTCLATRAIHLEVSHSLDTDSFLNALQRFVARRGSPTEIRSDNGTNLVGGLRELRKAIGEWNQQKISDHLLQTDVRWIFNPPAASHMGGVWERQIRTVRSVLNNVLALQRLDDEGLLTLFCSVEAIVNGRPITKLSEDPTDPLPLTPNHLLLLRAGPSLPPGNFVKQDLYRRRWRQAQYLADVFWARWIKEYLPALQRRQKWLHERRSLQVGDLVLILHEHTPRNSWPLGLITRAYPGDDGLVRSVQVKTAAGLLDRPASKICLLEANLVDAPN